MFRKGERVESGQPIEAEDSGGDGKEIMKPRLKIDRG
jgi:hypothetical protein